jgi:hypothetical protein
MFEDSGRTFIERLGPLAILAITLVAVRWGTFTAPPTWDAAMTIWPAGLEMSARNSISEVLSLPSYAEGGPNSHTLSLITLLSTIFIEIGGIDFAFIAMHVINSVLLLALGYLVVLTVSELCSKVTGWLTGAIVVLFPLMVAQSAYLYTELPTAFFVFLAVFLSFRGGHRWAILALTVAILIKPLALVAVPALAVVVWRKGGKRREIAAPALALFGLIPALLAPQPPPQSSTLLLKLSLVVETSLAWLMQAPELILLTLLPVAAYLVLRRREADREEWDWMWASSTLLATFAGFFALNAVVTTGHFFIPRYFVMLVGPIMVLLAITVSGLRPRIQVGLLGSLVLLSLIGVRGPLALGSGSPLAPTAERSLAFLDLLDDHRRGLDRLAKFGSEGTPVFHDHYASYAFSYPELGLHAGGVENATTVRSGDWGSELGDLPDQFAMLVQLPFLGGERLLRVRRLAESDEGYQVTIERIGSAEWLPVEVVFVEHLDQRSD